MSLTLLNQKTNHRTSIKYLHLTSKDIRAESHRAALTTEYKGILNNVEIRNSAVPFNDVRGQGGLGLLHFIYRRSLGILAPWIGH
jgi:hypothetical protein